MESAQTMIVHALQNLQNLTAVLSRRALRTPTPKVLGVGSKNRWAQKEAWWQDGDVTSSAKRPKLSPKPTTTLAAGKRSQNLADLFQDDVFVQLSSGLDTDSDSAE